MENDQQSYNSVAVRVYTKRFCGFCIRAKRLLAKKGVSFEELAIDGNPELRQKMIAETQRNTVPQIWIGEQHIGGWQELNSLQRNEQLDELLFPD